MSMELWDQLAIVDKKATKDFKRAGGFKGTDINPQWRMKRMTEVFGPVGIGWGYEVEDRWAESFENEGSGTETIAFVALKVWYLEEDKQVWTGQQIGGTATKWAKDEAYKQSITDALGKCFAQIGLGAEIYLGEFDNPVEYATSGEVDEIKALIDEHQITDLRRFFKQFGVSSIESLTSEQCRQATQMIKQKFGGGQ